MLLRAPETALIARFHELMDERGSGGERDTVSALAGSEAERQSGVRLAGSGRPERNDIAALLDPVAAGQLENQRLVERRLGGELERVWTVARHSG